MNSKWTYRIITEDGDPFEKKLTEQLQKGGLLNDTLRPAKGEEASIVILSPRLGSIASRSFAESSYLVFHSDSRAAADLAATGHCRLLDYGFSLRDSLTFSSLSEKQAVVALQRPLLLLTGEMLEPVEFPVALRGKIDADLLLSTAAVFLLCGKMAEFSLFP